MSRHRDPSNRLAQRPDAASAASSDEESLRNITAEHLALRRVAELVAKGGPQGELFDAVAVEASRLIKEDTSLLRVEPDGAYAVIAVCGGPAPVGTQFTIADDDEGLLAEIERTRRPARRDDYIGRGGPAIARDRFGVGSAVGVPVIVDDRIWGILLATTIDGRQLPVDTEKRLAQLAELMAAALANAQARSDLQRMADEQTALHQVAELIARTSPTETIFAAVAVNASRLLDDAPMTLTRFVGERELVVLATHGGPRPSGPASPMSRRRSPTKSAGAPARSGSTTTPMSRTPIWRSSSTWRPRYQCPSRSAARYGECSRPPLTAPRWPPGPKSGYSSSPAWLQPLWPTSRPAATCNHWPTNRPPCDRWPSSPPKTYPPTRYSRRWPDKPPD